MNSHNQLVHIVGNSGSGKQKVADLLSAAGFAVLSASYLLDTHGNKTLKDMIKRGQYVPDEIAVPIFLRAIREQSLGDIALDGMVRTAGQYKRIMPELKRMGFGRLRTIFVHLDEETARERMELRKRADDMPEIITRRLRFYKQHTEPLLRWFEADTEFYTIDNSGPPEELTVRFAEIIHAQPVMA